MQHLRSSVIFLVSIAACATSRAQSFNVDVGANGMFPAPSSAYGAAAAQPGTWNARSAGVLSAGLVDLSGAATSVTLTAAGGFADYEFDNPATLGDDNALLDDIHDLANGSATWTFQNLAAGSYLVYTYAWAPDSSGYVSSVACGSIDPAQPVGGSWAGAHQQGLTYARHHVDVSAGGSIPVVISTTSGFGSVNGFQLVKLATPATVFCSGDGSGTACPCGNSGLAGNGCANSLNAQGAHLGGSGIASIGNDTFVLQGSGMPNSSALYFQGTTQQSGGAGSVFGDGLRCAAGSVIRLGTKTNASGASQYPDAGDVLISIKGANAAGNARFYQCWYRNADPTFCVVAATFNLTNGVGVTWVP